jgi:hypothetical protein
MTIKIGHVLWIIGLFLIALPIRLSLTETRDAQWIVVPMILLFAGWSLRESFVHTLVAPTAMENFYFYAAQKVEAPEICERISPYAVERRMGMQSRPGHEAIYVRSKCYLYLATKLHDFKLCDHVRPVITPLVDGSAYNSRACQQQSVESDATVVATGPSVDKVPDTLRRLGYSPQSSDGSDTLSEVKSNPAARSEFIRRVLAFKP